MAEYIEREALIKAIASKKMVSVVPNCYEPKIKKAVCNLGQAIKAIIKNHPTADVVEVRHGKWVKVIGFDVDKRVWFMCSKCGRSVFVYPNDLDKIDVIFPYCHCGAKMDGKDGAECDRLMQMR